MNRLWERLLGFLLSRYEIPLWKQSLVNMIERLFPAPLEMWFRALQYPIFAGLVGVLAQG
jgi:hypothetical protein